MNLNESQIDRLTEANVDLQEQITILQNEAMRTPGLQIRINDQILIMQQQKTLIEKLRGIIDHKEAAILGIRNGRRKKNLMVFEARQTLERCRREHKEQIKALNEELAEMRRNETPAW